MATYQLSLEPSETSRLVQVIIAPTAVVLRVPALLVIAKPFLNPVLYRKRSLFR